MSRAQLRDIKSIGAFIVGGKAIFTLLNTETGSRFTYKISKPKRSNREDGPYFVSFLYGPDNTTNYSFVGTIWLNDDGPAYRHSYRKAKAAEDAPSVRGIKWLVGMVRVGKDLPDNFEFWHEGKCGVCSRRLTDPESIRTGIGPVCGGRMA